MGSLMTLKKRGKSLARGPPLRHQGHISVSNIQHPPSSETRDYQMVTGVVIVDKDGRYLSARRLHNLRQPHAQASSSTDFSDRGKTLEPTLMERGTVCVSFRWVDRATAHWTRRRTDQKTDERTRTGSLDPLRGTALHPDSSTVYDQFCSQASAELMWIL